MMFSLRDIFGPTGRLVEILSKEDQSLVLEVSTLKHKKTFCKRDHSCYVC